MQFDHKKGFVMSSLIENADGSVTVQVTPLKAIISETFFNWAVQSWRQRELLRD